MTASIHFIKDENRMLLSQQFEKLLIQTSKVFILLDENTRKYCLPVLFDLFPFLHSSSIIEIKSGEENKTLDTCKYIWKNLTEEGADRKSVLINLGGGVICDMGGFAASAFKRGIDFYHCPTTLLAQADAAIGGKTGIDFEGLKNLLGLFSNSKNIFIYHGFLKTLDSRQFLSGYAEIIKVALVADKNLWIKITNAGNPLEHFDYELVEKAVLLKSSITSEDFEEQGTRKILNFGHTIGHAFESFKMNTEENILHGEAVAAGIISEAFISLEKNMINKSFFDEINALILKLFPKIKFTKNDIPELLKIIDHDKKNESGNTRFSLLTGPGTAITNQEINKNLQKKSIRFYLDL